MKCAICRTTIQENEYFYWECWIRHGTEIKDNPVHSDCLIRKAEFSGENEQATEIHSSDLTEGINRGQ